MSRIGLLLILVWITACDQPAAPKCRVWYDTTNMKITEVKTGEVKTIPVVWEHKLGC